MLAELGTIEMNMHIDAPRRGDQAFGIAHRGRSATQQIFINTIHDCRVAGLADSGDTSLLYTNIALHHAQYRVDHDGVRHQHVERACGAVETGNQADPITQCFTATMQAFVAGNGVVMLDFSE